MASRAADRGPRRPWYPWAQAISAAMAVWTGCALAEDMAVDTCAQGKPQYCFKYGQTTCRKKNSLPKAAEACEQWTLACVEGQTAIAYCFERSAEPILDGSAECTACRAELEACMVQTDKQYWPNR